MRLNDQILDELEKYLLDLKKENKDRIYIDVNILNELGYKIDKNKKGKVYVDIIYLKIIIERYKFKGKVKIIPKQQTFRELEQEIKNIERGEK